MVLSKDELLALLQKALEAVFMLPPTNKLRDMANTVPAQRQRSRHCARWAAPLAGISRRAPAGVVRPTGRFCNTSAVTRRCGLPGGQLGMGHVQPQFLPVVLLRVAADQVIRPAAQGFGGLFPDHELEGSRRR